jgi:intermembrane space import and assembly protein 40
MPIQSPSFAFPSVIVYLKMSALLTSLPGPTHDADGAVEEALSLNLDSVRRPERTELRQTLQSATGATPVDNTPTSQAPRETPEGPSPPSPADLEEEASSEGAFNPETGEINWDCPCLGGMAHGPCGEDFKAAFRCFVFSKEDPKGMDCIDNFQKMQDCFREYPDVYAGELADDNEFEEGSEMAAERAELVSEVQERRRAVQEKQAQSEAEAPQKGLLEESASPHKPRKADSKSPAKSQKTRTTGEDILPPPSSEPHPGMSEEHKVAHLERRETMSEGVPSQVTSKPTLPPGQRRVEQ